MKITDNFLPDFEFISLQSTMYSPEFYWSYTKGIVDGQDDDFQFVHLFYTPKDGGQPCSDYWGNMLNLVKKMKIQTLYRIKANLRTKTPNIIESTPYHNDMQHLNLNKNENHWTTSIFYMNTNNGYTKFEGGTKVESVANRLVSFPAYMNHTGTSCTNINNRIVINFNYMKSPT